MAENEFMKVVEETLRLLKDNSEWCGRYADYADEIANKIPFISSTRSSFREWSPLKIYLNITSAKGARNSVSFQLRYLGQTIADLKGNKDEGFRLSTGRHKSPNSRHFNYDKCLRGEDWLGDNAKEFRRFFSDPNRSRNTDVKRKNREHLLESLLLTEFSKIERKEKPLLGIQPVTIAKVRFSMPTPISASKHTEVRYSGPKDGHVDILARTGTGGRSTRLCIMEVKDENVKRELPKDAMKQALAYATFIRELLRSDAGAAWWKVFGFGGGVPEQLQLYAACVMPSNENNDYSFGRMELKIDKDIIRLHYVYFHLIDEGKGIRILPGDTTLTTV